jgi:hypothetical protein
MGVTYKAVDVDQHCPVTLKVMGALRQPMNFLRPLSLGLEIQILGLERLGEGRKIGEEHRASLPDQTGRET